MKRVVVTEPGRLSIVEGERLQPGTGEVLLRVSYCGVCGSDLHAFKGSHPFISLPFSPGHEFSGTVAAVGEGVIGFQAGDRVVCEPNLVCGQCYNCRTGRYNICDELRVMGCQSEGAMAEYFLAPAEKTISIPDALSLRDAVLVEPLSVGMHAARVGGDLFNRNVIILGSGTIGLMVLACALKSGARKVTVVDLSRPRLETARRLGAHRTCLAGDADVVDDLKRSKPYEGFDTVFECVGIERTANAAVELVRKGGRVVICGVFGEDIRFRMALVQDREIELVGSLMYTRRDVQGAIELLAAGGIDTPLIITREYPLERSADAFEVAAGGGENIKVILNIGG